MFLGGKSVISDGWISNEDENQIFLTVTGDALKFYKSRHVEEKYGIKFVPFDLRNKHVSYFFYSIFLYYVKLF